MRGLILFLGLMVAALPALAQTPGPSREALTLGERAARGAQPKLEDGLQAIVDTLAKNYRTDSARIGLSIDERSLEEVSRSEVETERPRLWAGMARIYAETYTVDELGALITFYRGEPGAPPTRLPAPLAAKNKEIERRERDLVGQLSPRILQDFFGDYCSRSSCTDDVRRTAGLPVRTPKPAN